MSIKTILTAVADLPVTIQKASDRRYWNKIQADARRLGLADNEVRIQR